MTRPCLTVLFSLAFCAAAALPVFANDQTPAQRSAPGGSGDDSVSQNDRETAEQERDEQEEEIIRQFSRHRPGGCPEGPPCRYED